MKNTINKLKILLKNKNLPGFTAHNKMIPKGRIYEFKAENYKESAVNLILFSDNEALKFFLTKRSKKLTNHSGQISLPGGAKDFLDNNLWDTAKRETFEEIGIKIKNKNFVGKLTPLLADVSSFKIQPFVSFFDFEPKYIINTNEVEKLYIVNLKNFFSKNNIFYEKKTYNGNIIAYPYFSLQNEKVWGITAMILSEFFEIFKKSNKENAQIDL